MTTKEWLSRGRNLQQRIEALEESKTMAYTAATSTTPHSGGGSGGGGSGVSRKAEHYSALSEQVDQERERLDNIMAEITALIANVEDNNLATLLQDRYVRCLSWNQIAEEMHYNREHIVKRMHPKALRAAEMYLECTHRDVV